MAVDKLTLVELANRMQNSRLQQIAEVVRTEEEILDDLQFVEANNVTSHILTRRNTVPSGTWRNINEYVAPTASSTNPVEEHVGKLVDYSVVDKDLADLSGNARQFRRDEDEGHIQGLAQQLSTAIFYGDEGTDPAQFDGLKTRYNAVALPNVRDAGTTSGDMTSIYVVQHGRKAVHAIFPKGSDVGLGVKDLGQQTDTNSSGNKREVYTTYFTWGVGLAIHDDTCVQRICNIKVTETVASFDSWEDHVIFGLNNMPNRGKGAVIYCNIGILSQMDIKAKDKTNVEYSLNEVFGQTVVHFRGHPVKLCEQIVTDEARVL